MKCEVIRDLLPLYIDECLSNASLELVEEHLAGCEECREHLKKIKWEISVDEEEINRNISEQMLLKKGKEVIKKEIQWDYEMRFAMADFVINLLFIIAAL